MLLLLFVTVVRYFSTIPVSVDCCNAFMLVKKPTTAPDVSASTGMDSTPGTNSEGKKLYELIHQSA